MSIISLTSKGQITLPVEFRRRLGVKEGDKLEANFNPESKSLIIQKPLTVDELSRKVSSFIKNYPKPVTNVDEYYQMNRDKDE
jgi:AbrB family looped-hinge helix DNA binding protein